MGQLGVGAAMYANRLPSCCWCHPSSLLPCREEFTNYMFLERSQEASVINENWRLFPQDFKERNDVSVTHRGAPAGCAIARARVQ